ncbi:MAG TPA: hypothetical protein VJN71_01415 [Nitrososphaerales archaeon]|nr:hypothetical protein [Nitrososphaerales archaeon]
MFSILAMLTLPHLWLDITSLFDFTASMVAFLFIVVVVLIFIYIYDNLRRGKKTTAST